MCWLDYDIRGLAVVYSLDPRLTLDIFEILLWSKNKNKFSIISANIKKKIR